MRGGPLSPRPGGLTWTGTAPPRLSSSWSPVRFAHERARARAPRGGTRGGRSDRPPGGRRGAALAPGPGGAARRRARRGLRERSRAAPPRAQRRRHRVRRLTIVATARPRRLRLDAELVRRGLARSREQASELIAAGRVTVNGT